MKSLMESMLFGLVLVGLAAAAHAQEGPKHVGRKMPPAPSTPQAGAGLDEAGLRALLVSLGYEPEALTHGESPAFRILVRHGEGYLKHRVIWHAESGLVEIFCGMDAALQPGEKNPDRWYRTLAEGVADLPAAVRVTADGGLIVSTYVGGGILTAAGLREAIARQVATIDGTVMPLIRQIHPQHDVYTHPGAAEPSSPPAIPLKKVVRKPLLPS